MGGLDTEDKDFMRIMKGISLLSYIQKIKGVLYSMLGPDLLGLTVAVRNIVGQCLLLNQGIKRKF